MGTVIISEENVERLAWKKYYLGKGAQTQPDRHSRSTSKQKLVILHGYGQASALFYPIL